MGRSEREMNEDLDNLWLYLRRAKTIKEMMKKFKTSRATMDRWVRRLSDEGLANKQKGWPTQPRQTRWKSRPHTPDSRW
jgi:transposase